MNSSLPFYDRRTKFKAGLRTAVATLSSVTGLTFLWHQLFARHGVRILAYHGVESPPTNPFCVSVENFEKQIAHLSELYDIIDLKTYLDWTQGKYQSDRPKVVLTFDDGFRNNLDHAAPVLKKYDVPGIFFIIGSKTSGDDPRFMTVSDIEALLQFDRFQIGSHTMNHYSIAQIDAAERDRQIGESKTFLQEQTGRTIPYFCYPYGTYNDFNAESVYDLKRHGYALACTSVNGVNFRQTDPYRLRRTKVEWSDDIRTFRRLVRGALDSWIAVDFFLRFLQRPRAVKFDDEENSVTSANN